MQCAVTIYRTQGDAGAKAQYGGLETCGSVWNCPCCAPRITEARREEIATALERHRDAGGGAYMATFSIPHYAHHSCKRTRTVVAQAWRKLVAGAPWQRLRKRYGLDGWVRALETTHGQNGWHPHIHALIFTAAPLHPTALQELRFALFERWAAIVERMGQGLCSMLAFDLRPADASSGAADYVGKWGADAELTKAHMKRAGKGGRTPWGILRDLAETGEARDAALFQEYAKAFKGARQLTWSKGFRARYLDRERADDEIAAAVEAAPDDAVAIIDNPTWREIAARHLTAVVLDAAEQGGRSAVVAVLARHGVSSDGVYPPHEKSPAGAARQRDRPCTASDHV